MVKKILCVAALAGAVLANKNFAPDWTFSGSSLNGYRTLGQADWRAENGEIIGTPKSAEGGWLFIDKPLQDVQFASSFRCTGGCSAGVLVRAETAPEGIKGVYIALPNGQTAAEAFALRLDAQGHETGREALKPAGGMVRFIAPPPPGRGAPPAGGGRGRGAGPGALGAALPPQSPYTRPDYSYKPDQWNNLEILMDANILRVWLNDGPEGGATNGQADDAIGRYGPIALHVAGSGEVRFKQVELKDLGKRMLPNEQVSSRFRMQRISDFYYGWSATAADINHDGILDVVAGPFYYLGPDYQISREIFLSQTSNVSLQYTPSMVNFAWDYTGDGWPDVLVTDSRPISMYVNPKNELRRWDKYPILPGSSSEINVFKDVDGDGVPDIIYIGGGAVNYATVNPENPTAPWKVHSVSAQGYGIPAQHGVGAGDINGDGRVDIVSP